MTSINASLSYTNLFDAAAASVVASSQTTLTPAQARLQDRHVARKWRSTGTTEFLTIDLGSGVSVDTVALMGVNISATGTTRVRASLTNAAATGSLLYDSGSIAGAVDPNYGYLVTLITSPVTVRYIRIDIADATKSYIEAGRLFVGLRTQVAVNFSPGWSHSFIDRTRKTEGRGGQMFMDIDNSYRILDLTFGFLSQAEHDGFVETIDRDLGEHNDFLFIIDPTSTNLGRDSRWGFIDGNQPAVGPYTFNVFSKSYKLRERL